MTAQCFASQLVCNVKAHARGGHRGAPAHPSNQLNISQLHRGARFVTLCISMLNTWFCQCLPCRVLYCGVCRGCGDVRSWRNEVGACLFTWLLPLFATHWLGNLAGICFARSSILIPNGALWKQGKRSCTGLSEKCSVCYNCLLNFLSRKCGK